MFAVRARERERYIDIEIAYSVIASLTRCASTSTLNGYSIRHNRSLRQHVYLIRVANLG